MYYLPGHISAMCILDTAAFFIMAQLTKKLTNNSFIQRKGAFKVIEANFFSL
jgi:hypothetical protein